MANFEAKLDPGFQRVANNLLPALEAAVPMHVWQLRDYTDAERVRIGHEAADVIAFQGDVLMFKVKGKTAAAFNTLARALAALAYQPGGVTVFGRHWCIDHAACRVAEEWAKAQPPLAESSPDETGRDESEQRPIVNVYLPGDAPAQERAA